MLNKVILSGRITRDLEVKQTTNGNAVVTFNLAVDRNFVKQGEERQTDFITCVAWGKTAEFIGRFFSKGRSIAIIGNLRSRTYDDKNGTKHYVTEVYVDEAQFTFEPKSQNGGYNNGGYPQQGGYNNGGGYNQGGGYNNNGGYGGQQGGYNGGYAPQGGYQPEAPAPQKNNGYQNQAPQPDDPINIGKYEDFETFNDDGVPF